MLGGSDICHVPSLAPIGSLAVLPAHSARTGEIRLDVPLFSSK